MAKIRIVKWFIEKNGINADAETWYEIKGSTEKAYRTEIGWIPKSCITAYDDSREASLLTDKAYRRSFAEGESKYYIKESWKFNLEAMWDKLWVIAHETEDSAYPITIAGYVCRNAGDVLEVREWSADLHSRGFAHRVTGKEFAEIRRIVGWRVEARYAACMAAGMNEADAGYCFEDL